MPQHSRDGSRTCRTFVVAFVVAAVVASIAISLQGRAPVPSAADAAGAAVVATPRVVAPAAVAAAEDAAEPPLERTPVAPPRVVAAPTFEQRIERLVDLGIRTSELAQADEIEAASAADAESRSEFAALLDAFADAGERALAMAGADTGDAATADLRTATRRFVLQLVVAAECARRHDAAVAADDHSRSEPLVQALLDVMPQATTLAELGERTLTDQPFLRAAHEPAVLGLVEQASDGRFSREIATRLLLTLWDNLRRTGERSPEELSRAAMLLLADPDPSKRTAACRQLLGDPRHRPMVLAWLREHGDRGVAADIAGIAVRDLEPAAALLVLRELAPVLHRSPNSYMVLGSRAPDLLADAYRELLASNTQPGIRTDLVAGIGFASAPSSLDLAEFALQNDPSPEVRIQAAFAMTAGGDVDRGERAISQLLDEPAIASDPNRLGALVLALQNLEAGGGINAIDRLAQRLRTMPLSESGRQQLEALIARSMPDGRVSSRTEPARPR